MGNFSRLGFGLVVSAIVTLFITLLFIDRGDEYSGEVVFIMDYDLYKQGYYFDLDGDGKSEKLSISQTTTMSTAVIVYDENGDLVDQHNFRGRRVPRSELYCGDIEGDGLIEGVLFTSVGDSLFLNVFWPLVPSNPYMASLFIDECKLLDGEALYRISNCNLYDISGDGVKEIYFGVSGGFILRPRNIYYADIVSGRVAKSPEAGVGPRALLKMSDINGDGFPEFWGPISAPNNFKEPVPFSDTASWLMMYNRDLQFLFEPIPMGPATSTVITNVIADNKGSHIFAIYSYPGNSDTHESYIALVGLDGSIIKSRNISELGIGKNINAFPVNNELWITHSNLKISKISTNLDLVKEVSKPFMNGYVYKPLDLLGDGAPELIFSDLMGRHTITDLDFNVKLIFETGDMNYPLSDPLKVVSAELGDGIYMRTAGKEYFVKVVPNRVREMYFVYVGLIFLVSYLLVNIVIILTRRQEKRKQEREKQLRGLQLQSLKSQVNPHFIFNALNSISAMYLRGDTDKADTFLTGFSRLIREVVVSSEKTIVSLGDEIKFVTSYLDLEKVRLGDNFSYVIDLPSTCRKMKIPSMAVHTFVENAIKHGLKDLTEERLLEIVVVKQEKRIKISISDNGPGFGLSTPSKGSTGKGLKNITKIFKSYTGITGKKISWSVVNSDSTNGGVGTTIKILCDI